MSTTSLVHMAKIVKYVKTIQSESLFLEGTGARFSKVPQKFLYPEKPSKISNRMITELFYSHILI